MKQIYVKTEFANYEPVEYDSEAPPPVTPEWDKVLVLADKAADRIGSIMIPEEQISRFNRAAESGVIIAVGPDAFKWNATRTEPYAGDPPAIGDRVCFARYAGQSFWRDGMMYMMMSDVSIIGRENR